jgi:hypothetical protein
MLTIEDIPELTDVDVAFAAKALDWMPDWEEIPDEYKQHNGTDANKIVSSWFFNGLNSDVEFYPREDVDPEKAVKVIQATLGSFASKHEHKEAAAAYMLDSWFEEVKYWKTDKE